MKISRSLSFFLRYTSFVAACCVVAIHANTVHRVDHPTHWNLLYHRFLCGWILCWAVPFFFACSGFFFALGDYVRIGQEQWFKFIRKKVGSLLIPYFSWGIIGTVICVPLCMLANRMAGRQIFENTVFSGGIFRFFDYVFGIIRVSPLHNGVLWYVKALFILFMFAPVWKLFSNRALAWVLVILWVSMRWIFPTLNICGFELFTTQMSFFFLGIAVAVYCQPRVLFNNRVNFQAKLPEFTRYSFWIYCTHNILLAYILSVGHHVLGKSNCAIAMLTTISIPLAIFLSLFLAKRVSQKWPTAFRVLNGGR